MTSLCYISSSGCLRDAAKGDDADGKSSSAVADNGAASVLFYCNMCICKERWLPQAK